MRHCCEKDARELTVLRRRQGGVLWTVLTVNSVMFLVELTAGFLGRSTALVADSLDMLGDASVYAFSLFALNRGPAWRNRAATLKGLIMVAFGLGVFGEAIAKALTGTIPSGQTMGAVGAMALLANLLCLALLFHHRDDDLNMRSTWLCSRNDILANLGVLVAAGLVLALQSNWPDILVGLAIAGLFLASASRVLRASFAGLPSAGASLVSDRRAGDSRGALHDAGG